jgi:predicted MFS family arabinose efflux permease
LLATKTFLTTSYKASALNAHFLLRVFVPFALGYFLSYCLRTINAIIAPQLNSELSLNAASLGFLTAAYFLPFAAMQIPLGRWLDKHPPRKVEAGLLLFAAVGASVFALAQDFTMLVIARALVGAGVCCCLMASFRTFTQWLPKDKLPLMNGIQLAVGSIGAISITAPAQALIPVLGWRGMFWVMVGLLLVCSAWLYLFTPDPPVSNAPFNVPAAQNSVNFNVWKSPIFWTLVPFAALNAAHGMSMQALWASPWLTDVAGVSKASLGPTLALVSVGMLIGNVAGGALASAVSKRGILPHQVGIVLCLIALVTQLPIVLGWTTSPALWMLLFGLFNSSGNLVFASANHFFAPQVLGRVFAAFNLVMFTLVFFVQWGTGLVVNLFPKTGGGYEAKGYAFAFGTLAIAQVLGLIWYALRRHTLVPLK